MNIGECLKWGSQQLGLDKRLEVEMLLAFVVGFDRAKLLAYPEVELGQEQQQSFAQLVERRKDEEPLHRASPDRDPFHGRVPR